MHSGLLFCFTESKESPHVSHFDGPEDITLKGKPTAHPQTNKQKKRKKNQNTDTCMTPIQGTHVRHDQCQESGVGSIGSFLSELEDSIGKMKNTLD